jgi:hypothetical protein
MSPASCLEFDLAESLWQGSTCERQTGIRLGILSAFEMLRQLRPVYSGVESSNSAVEFSLASESLMPAPSLEQKIEQLVVEQIHMFKQPAKMDSGEIFEYHLRHYQIMLLYGEMDRSKSSSVRVQGSLPLN